MSTKINPGEKQRFRFVLQLDWADGTDPDFQNLGDIQATEIHTRLVDSEVDLEHQPMTWNMNDIFKEVEEFIAKRLKEKGMEY